MLTLIAALTQLPVSLAERIPSDKGSTAAEYGLVLGFIALAIVLGATAVGVNLNDFIAQQAATIAGW